MSLFLVGFVCLVFGACEGYRCGNGNVIDEQTGQPIDSVLCTAITAGDKQQFTDSVGHFDICNYMGGCIPHCRDIQIEFSKTGYKTVKLENPGEVVYLER